MPGWTSPALGLPLLSVAAVLVQGYHLGTDDAEIYTPAIKQIVDPSLYPRSAEFFLAHARYGHLSSVAGHSARLLHLRADPAILLWHLLGVFLLVYAGWRVAGTLFTSRRAVWGAVAALALTLSVPVAGTALVIADPYLTARSFSTPFSLLAVAALLRGERWGLVAWLLLTGYVHPQMVVYTVGLLAFLLFPVLSPARMPARAAAVPSLLKSFSLQPATGTDHDLLYSRTFFFASLWRWWEYLGILLPLAILAACSRAQLRGLSAAGRRVCRALVAFGMVSTAFWLMLAASPRFDSLQRLQPMRSFDLIYIFLFLILGGLLAEYALGARPWRWAAFFAPLAAGMCALNLALYPASPHIELPGRAGANRWLAAFYWVRANTPKDAFFALDPRYLELPGEDEHGFRAVAERGRLADFYKDSGVATMFPELGEKWARDERALGGWNGFDRDAFARLHRQTGADWVVLERAVPGLACPYGQSGILVCRIGNSPEMGKDKTDADR